MKRKLISIVLSAVFLITGLMSVSGCSSKKNISQDKFVKYFDKNNYDNEYLNYRFSGSLPDDFDFFDRYMFGGYDSLLVFENLTEKTETQFMTQIQGIEGCLCEYKSSYYEWYFVNYEESFGTLQNTMEEYLASDNEYYSYLAEGGYHISERPLSVIYGEDKRAGVKYFLEVDAECIIYVLANKKDVLILESFYQYDHSIDNGYNALNEYCRDLNIYAPDELIADSEYREMERVQSEWWNKNGAEVERVTADMIEAVRLILEYT